MQIKSYTIPQMLLFYCAALQNRVKYMQDVRTAVWADGDNLKAYINDILKK